MLTPKEKNQMYKDNSRRTLLDYGSSVWKKVLITSSSRDCWLWRGGVDRGAPRVSAHGASQMSARAIVYRLYFGYLPEEYGAVKLSCSNTLCLNPMHMYYAYPYGRIKNGIGDVKFKCGHSTEPENLHRNGRYTDGKQRYSCKKCKYEPKKSKTTKKTT